MRVGFCGLGNMGLPMAGRLLELGHQVTVWNRTPGRAEELRTRGAEVAPSPAEAARMEEAAITMLADDEALESVVFGAGGLAQGMPPGSALIDMSTVGPDAIRSIGAGMPPGVEVLDAPVKGGPAKAAKGELRILVGGSEEAFRRYAPLLEALGAPRHLGPLGTGAAAKVLNNFAVITLVSVLGEAMALAGALGIEERVALEILSGTPLAPTVERQWKRASGQGPPSFKLRLAKKDLALAVQSALANGRTRLRAGEQALSWLRDAAERGLAERDQATVVELIRSGVVDVED